MTGETQLALDLVQESFVRYLDRYSGRNPNKSLLYTIARNAAIDALRKQKVYQTGLFDQEDTGCNPEQQVVNREAFDRTLKAIMKLSPPDREMISLAATADLTYREIARVLNISEVNVKVRIHRSRMKLKAILSSGGK